MILQTLNLNLEVYWQRLCKISFGPDDQPQSEAQKVWVACLQWLHPAVHTAAQVVEPVMVEHYDSILPFKPNN